MDISKIIASELNIRVSQAGGLSDEILRDLDERLTYLRNLQERKDSVLNSIEEQGKLTDELKKAIDDATTLVAVEDLYRPYKQKRRTRATIAKEQGLEGLAKWLLSGHKDHSVKEEAGKYLDEEKGVSTGRCPCRSKGYNR